MAEEQGEKKWEQGMIKDDKVITSCPSCGIQFWIPGTTFEQRPDPMQGRILQPEKLGELAAALAKARAQFQPIPKNQTVKVTMKSGGTYSFKFADLGCILSATTDALAENGLAVIQLPVDMDASFVETILAHESGCAIISRQSLPAYLQITSAFDLNAAMQARGSAISFLRRYAISSVLNIAVQDDDDGNIVVGNEYQQQDKKAQGKAKPKPEKPKPKEKEVPRPALEAMKVAYFELLKSTASFPNDKDDVARHAWQKLITKKESTKIWSQGDYDRAMLMLNWRMIVGEESDALVEYLEKHRTSRKGMGDKFLDVMGVGQLTEIQDVTHWPLAMSAALQWYNTKEQVAIDMGRALLRAAQHEGLIDTFLKVCEVDKVSKLTKEQVTEWHGLLEKSIAEWIEAKGLDDTEIPDVAGILNDLTEGDQT